MKTAVSLPDEIFRDADRLARRLKRSRSELYRDALSEYLARHDPDSVTEALNRVIRDVDSKPDDFVTSAARHVLHDSEW